MARILAQEVSEDPKREPNSLQHQHFHISLARRIQDRPTHKVDLYHLQQTPRRWYCEVSDTFVGRTSGFLQPSTGASRQRCFLLVALRVGTEGGKGYSRVWYSKIQYSIVCG